MTSWDEKERSGSARGWRRFRSPTTKSGAPVLGKRDSEGTEWTLGSAELIEYPLTSIKEWKREPKTGFWQEMSRDMTSTLSVNLGSTEK